MDGANMNAQVGLCRPADIGADVCHLNLHKTFCIPHGGGGPGVGPIGVAEHLVEFLPGHPVVNLGGENPIGAVAAAPWGSAGILPISWMYIAMMGADGLTEATRVRHPQRELHRQAAGKLFPDTLPQQRPRCARVHPRFAPVQERHRRGRGEAADGLWFSRADDFVARPRHDDGRADRERIESGTGPFLRRDDCHSRRNQRDRIRQGGPAKQPAQKCAAHGGHGCGDNWNRPYSREQAAFPVPGLRDHKFWPHVGRVDNVFGDRNPVCTCAGMENYS